MTVNPESEGGSSEAEKERRATIERHARPWMICAYVLTAVGCAVVFLGPRVALGEYSSLRLGAITVSLAGSACFLILVSFRYPESLQGNEFRVAIAMVCGLVVTGVFVSYCGLFDADFYVLGTQPLARWLTQWEGGWGQSFVAGFLSLLPTIPAMGLFGYLFNADPSIRRSFRPWKEDRDRPYESKRLVE